MLPRPIALVALVAAATTLVAIGGCGEDTCDQAAARIARCSGSVPSAFADGCRSHPEWADAILASDCSMAGKADGTGPSVPAVPAVKATRIVVDVYGRTLSLYGPSDEQLAVFSASFGWGEYLDDEGKRKQGDHRTPRGTYRLFGRRAASKFRVFLPVSYPNAEDAARGLADGLISQAEHDAIVSATRAGRMPPQDTALGGLIGIHGFAGGAFEFVPPAYQHLHRWGANITEGCILLTDAEIEVLAQSFEPGAVLEIIHDEPSWDLWW